MAMIDAGYTVVPAIPDGTKPYIEEVSDAVAFDPREVA
jgi:hypothetical protein